MKSTTLLLVGVLIATACNNSQNTPEAKKQRLEGLRKEQSRIAVDIAQLELDIAKGGKSTDSSSSDKAKAVRVTTVAASPFKHYVEVQGQVSSDKVVQVTAKQPGLIQRVLVKEGDRVSAGQTLAVLDNETQRTQVGEIRTQLDLARTIYEKQKGLWDQKIGSEVQYLNVKAQKEGLERRLSSLNTALSQANILAPISGTIDEVNARDGEAAISGMGLFRLVNLTDLKVTGNVSESYLRYLNKGAQVEVDFPDLDQTRKGTISFVSSVVDPTTRAVTVEVRLTSTKDLRPNQLAKLRINDRTLPSVIVIDQNIVQTSEQGDVVFVATEQGGKIVAQPRKVQIGLSYNGQVVIEKGLKAGDKIISQGYQDMTEGQTIAIN